MKKHIAILIAGLIVSTPAFGQVTINFPQTGVMPILPREPSAGMVITTKYESFEMTVRNSKFSDGTYGRELIPNSVRVVFFSPQGAILNTPYWVEVGNLVSSARISRADLEQTATMLGLAWPSDGAQEVQVTMVAFAYKIASILQVGDDDTQAFVQNLLVKLAE